MISESEDIRPMAMRIHDQQGHRDGQDDDVRKRKRQQLDHDGRGSERLEIISASSKSCAHQNDERIEGEAEKRGPDQLP